MPSLSLEYMAHGSLHHLLVKKLDLKYLFEDVLNKIWTIVLSTFNLLKQNLKSVNSNFTLAVHSQKFGQAKTHFLSHFGEKKEKNMARPGFEPTISRSEVDRANHYSIGPLLENQQIYLCNIHCDETKSESWPVQIFVSVLPE